METLTSGNCQVPTGKMVFAIVFKTKIKIRYHEKDLRSFAFLLQLICCSSVPNDEPCPRFFNSPRLDHHARLIMYFEFRAFVHSTLR